MNYEGRLARLQQILAARGIDALLVTNLNNVRYLTGFSGTNGQVLVSSSGAHFLTDPRYEARAGTSVQAAEVEIYPVTLLDILPKCVSDLGVRRLGIEGASTTLTQFDEIRTGVAAELVQTSNVIEDLRRTKDADEIDRIRSAVALADEAFGWVLDRLAPGASERELALDIEMRMRLAGADEMSFPPIVASGPLSAHIHHTPTKRSIEKGDLVLLDFGCRVDGYCSDLTRTVVLGPATEEQERVYDLVLRAQETGIHALREGVGARAVDAAARGVIEQAGYSREFGHGLGHGVGLEVHEAPRLRTTSGDELRAGDVVTVEPGVYQVDVGGIRIEDCVLVTTGGAEVLTGAPKDRLLEL